jgi:hypothetical protein
MSISSNPDYDVYNNDDADNHLRPTWLNQPRGFLDQAQQSADELDAFLSAHLSFAVQSWALSQRRWVFRFQDLEVELLHGPGQPLATTATSQVIPRKHLDPLRAELRAVLNRALGE